MVLLLCIVYKIPKYTNVLKEILDSNLAASSNYGAKQSRVWQNWQLTWKYLSRSWLHAATARGQLTKGWPRYELTFCLTVNSTGCNRQMVLKIKNLSNKFCEIPSGGLLCHIWWVTTLLWWRGLHVPEILRVMLSGAMLLEGSHLASSSRGWCQMKCDSRKTSTVEKAEDNVQVYSGLLQQLWRWRKSAAEWDLQLSWSPYRW